MKSKNGGKTVYVVAWASINSDTGDMDSGHFRQCYATEKDAKMAVRTAIMNDVREEIDCYEKDELEDVFGTADFDGIVDSFIADERDDFVVVKNPNNDNETQYSIKSYDIG